MSKRGLGKGLQALIPAINEVNPENETVREIEVWKIVPNPYQPRRDFDQGKLVELMNSIKEVGLVQPVIVRKIKEGYQLVAGERRLRAVQSLGWDKIPAVIKEVSDPQMMELALIENIQRQDLNPIEEALAYKKLIEKFNYTQENLAARLGKSRSLIANMVRLLKLPEHIQELISKSLLSAGHGRALLALEGPELQQKVAEDIIKKNLSVRETEELVNKINHDKECKVNPPEDDKQKNPNLVDLEEKLCAYFGTKVKIKGNGLRGKIEIEYFNIEELERILEICNLK